jgi:hypothetical protein
VVTMMLALGVIDARAQPIGSRGTSVQVFIGAVKVVSPSTFTLLAGTKTTVFAWDAKTRVGVAGGAPRPVPSIPNVLHVGDQVTVKARDVKGTMLATDISVQAPVQPSVQPSVKTGKK